jgi:hypothetical protein
VGQQNGIRHLLDDLYSFTLALAVLTFGGCAAGSLQRGGSTAAQTSHKPRVIVTTDPELDDSNSLVGYLLFSSEFRTEGLVYVDRAQHEQDVVKAQSWA